MIVTKQNMKPYYTDEDFPNIATVGLYAWYTTLTGDFKQHSHSFSETVIILNGTGVHLVGDHEYMLSRGDTFAIKGSTSHGFKDTQNMEFLNLIYDPHIFLQKSNELQSIPGFIPFFLTEPEARHFGHYTSMLKLDEEALSYVRMMGDFIVNQFKDREAAQQAVIKINFLALISYIATKYDNASSGAEHIYYIGSAIDYMEKNMEDPIMLEDIATEVHISARQLSRIFIKYLEVSPMIYLRNMRLKSALTMLSQSEASVAEVSRKCGFVDPAYFSRVFRETYGKSPSQAKRVNNR